MVSDTYLPADSDAPHKAIDVNDNEIQARAEPILTRITSRACRWAWPGLFVNNAVHCFTPNFSLSTWPHQERDA